MSMGPIGSGESLKNTSGVLYSLTGTGQSASVPIGPSKRIIKKSDTVIIDIPCHINGYHIDQTRSFVAGKAQPGTKECYKALKLISDHLIHEIIRPGISCKS
ncbi:MAG: aminopeptidase P family protein, partial [Desulfobacula sp.]|nr:aminopeptidase P family protein [Desulfobacula sp.]